MMFKPKNKTINVILMDGGVGDHIASLVAVDYILKNYPWITPLVWMPDYLVELSKHLLDRGDPMNIRGFTEMRGRYDQNRPTKTTKWDGHTSPMKIHCVDYAFLKLCDENPSIEHKNYLQLKPDRSFDMGLPKKYVVVTTGYTAAVREFPAKEINKTVDAIVAKGYTPVFLGQTNTKTGAAHTIKGSFDQNIDFSKGINLIDKTTLLEATRIMSGAAAVIGVDNGLLHLAGCTKSFIVGGFTTVSPELRMPIRHNTLGWKYIAIEPDEDLKCKFCQVKTNFLYEHNYVNCMEKHLKCTKQMTAEKFIDILERIL